MNASPAMQRALDEINALGTREIDLTRAANHRRKQRTDRRKRVIIYTQQDGYWPLMTWLSDAAPRKFLSLDEARAWLRKEIRRIERQRNHWTYVDIGHRLPGLRARFIVASYFARFGAEIWQREAA